MLKLKRLFLIALFTLLIPVAIPQNVNAACSTSGTIGSVTMSGSVPDAGEYVVWVRVFQSAPATNALMLEVEGSSCFSVGSAAMPANTWVWVNYKSANTSDLMKHTFNSAGSKSVKVLATTAGVRADRVILLGSSEQCESNGNTPTGEGDNCSQAPASPPPSGWGGTTVPPSTPGESPSILPDIVAAQPENVEKVEYYVNGELVQTSEGAEPLDTSKLPAGTYNLTTKVTYKDGTSAEAEQTIDIVKDNTFLGMIKRGLNRYRKLVLVLASALLIISIAVAALAVYRYLRRRKIYYLTHWTNQS